MYTGARINNSLSTFLEQAMILEQNSLEKISKVYDAVMSNADNVTLTLSDPNGGEDKIISIPSFSYLKNEIARLDETLKTITNVGDKSTGGRIRLSDGTTRKIISSKLPTEAPTITTVNNITNFNFKSNYFFEDMLNPCLFVTWDMSNQISPDTDRVMIRRYILSCDTQIKIDVFDKIKGRSDINYNDFLKSLVSNKIRYTLDDETKNLPPRTKRYVGDFTVSRIFTENVLNISYIRYIFNTLEYTDTRANYQNTRLLSVGDYVEVYNNPITTRYVVTYVSQSEHTVGLRLVEGFDRIETGSKLRISSTQDSEISVDIPVGFDEREVVFVKPIDPDSNIPSNEWSPGVAFYTNELTYADSLGNKQTLQRFYQKNVVDFGQILLSYANDYYPSIREGIIPNKPVLNYFNGSGDIRVVQINKQLTENSDNESIRKLISNKIQLQSELDNLNDQITKQKEVIQTTNFVSTNEKLKAQSTLTSLTNNHNTVTKQYNSVVNSIKSKYDSGNYVEPKYRIRGFFDIPDSKYSESSGEQKIIKFKVRYRYLSYSGNANNEEVFTYTSNGNTISGRFSNWNEYETKMRERIKTSSGWEWEDIDTTDPESININQIDIPITRGERVEIQVKSVSEAGWPSNPLESEWSDAIIVSFSDFSELEADDLNDLIKQNNVDSAISTVLAQYNGTTEHLNTSFYTNDKYFAHTAESITSGFLSPEQTPITLYDKLHELQNQITAIIETINKSMGKLIVSLVDNSDVSKIYPLMEGNTTYVDAGNYLDDISNLDNDKKNGAIVTKTFYLEIKSDNQSGLYLLSKLPGYRYSMCPSTISKDTVNKCSNPSGDYNLYLKYDNIEFPTTVSNDYYKNVGRYDLVPINLSNSSAYDYMMYSPNMYQSSQCRAQFVYSRFRNLGNTQDLYANSVDENGYGIFDETAKFTDGEMIYNFDNDSYNNYIKLYASGDGDDKEAIQSGMNNIISEYNRLTGSTIDLKSIYKDEIPIDYFNKLFNGYMSKGGIKDVLNRLPKTFNSKQSTFNKSMSDKKLFMRLQNIDNEESFKDDVVSNYRLVKRIKEQTDGGIGRIIEPKLQTAYGYADLGLIKNIDLDEKNNDDDGNYVTTHKIGYEERDRYAIGKETCNSYLFLSPNNIGDLQVPGDNDRSNVVVTNNESIRVPIIYQYRMTDYNGNIFGDAQNMSTDSVVLNAKYANIIGIDIWVDTNSEKPHQYDIVVYSTYGNTVKTDSGDKKTSTQKLVDAYNYVSRMDNSLIEQSQSLTRTSQSTSAVDTINTEVVSSLF